MMAPAPMPRPPPSLFFFSISLSPSPPTQTKMGALSNLLTSRHAEIAKVLLPTSIATGFVWTMASGKPLLDPYRWLSGEPKRR